MIVGAGLALLAVLAGVYLRGRSEHEPLGRDELPRMRKYYDRMHREEVLPFD